jgi:hypothetical protein
VVESPGFQWEKKLGFLIFPIKMGMKLIKPSGNDGNLGFYPAKMES